jgi:hypothetical protein
MHDEEMDMVCAATIDGGGCMCYVVARVSNEKATARAVSMKSKGALGQGGCCLGSSQKTTRLVLAMNIERKGGIRRRKT